MYSMNKLLKYVDNPNFTNSIELKNTSNNNKSKILITLLIILLILDIIEYNFINKITEKNKYEKELKILSITKPIIIVMICMFIYTMTIDPFLFIFHSLTTWKSFGRSRYIHLYNIIDDYILNFDKNIHGDKILNILSNIKSHYNDYNKVYEKIISNIYEKKKYINDNWKKINGRYWIPINDKKIIKVRALENDTLNKLDKTTQYTKYNTDVENLKITEILLDNNDIINNLFTDDLIYNLNNSNYNDIFKMIIIYIYNSRDQDKTFKLLKDILNEISENNKLTSYVKDILNTILKEDIINYDTDNSINDIKYYLYFINELSFNDFNKLNNFFTNTLDKKSFNIKGLIDIVNQSILKSYPYITLKTASITKSLYKNIIENTSTFNINMQSLLDSNNIKQIYFNYYKSIFLDKIKELNINTINNTQKINSSSYNLLYNEYDKYNISNFFDEIYNWGYTNQTIDSLSSFFNINYLKDSNLLHNFSIYSELKEDINWIYSSIKLIEDQLLNENIILYNEFNNISKLDTINPLNIKTIIKQIDITIKQIIDNNSNNNNTDLLKNKFSIGILPFTKTINVPESIKNRLNSNWLKQEFSLRYLQMIYRIKKYAYTNIKIKKIFKLDQIEKDSYINAYNIINNLKKDSSVLDDDDYISNINIDINTMNYIEKINKNIYDKIRDAIKKRYTSIPNEEQQEEILNYVRNNDEPPIQPTEIKGGMEVNENVQDENENVVIDILDKENYNEEEFNILKDENLLAEQCDEIIIYLDNIKKIRNKLLDSTSINNNIVKELKDLYIDKDFHLYIINIDTGVILTILIIISYLIFNQYEKNFNNMNRMQILILIIGLIFYIISHDSLIRTILKNNNIHYLLYLNLIIKLIVHLYFYYYNNKYKEENNIYSKLLFFNISDIVKIYSNDNISYKEKTKLIVLKGLKFLISIIDIFLIMIYIIVLVFYIKPLFFKYTNTKLNILNYDKTYNIIKDSIVLELQRAKNYDFKLLYNIYPEQKEVLVLLDNVNIVSNNSIDIYKNIASKLLGLYIIYNVLTHIMYYNESDYINNKNPQKLVAYYIDIIIIYGMVMFLLFAPNIVDIVRSCAFKIISVIYSKNDISTSNLFSPINIKIYGSRLLIVGGIIFVIFLYLRHFATDIDIQKTINYYLATEQRNYIKNIKQNISKELYSTQFIILFVTLLLCDILYECGIVIFTKNLSSILFNSNTYQIIENFEYLIKNNIENNNNIIGGNIIGGNNCYGILKSIYNNRNIRNCIGFILYIFILYIIYILLRKYINNNNIIKDNYKEKEEEEEEDKDNNKIKDNNKNNNKKIRYYGGTVFSYWLCDIFNIDILNNANKMLTIQVIIIISIILIICFKMYLNINNDTIKLYHHDLISYNENTITPKIIIIPIILFIFIVIIYSIHIKDTCYIDYHFNIKNFNKQTLCKKDDILIIIYYIYYLILPILIILSLYISIHLCDMSIVSSLTVVLLSLFFLFILNFIGKKIYLLMQSENVYITLSTEKKNVKKNIIYKEYKYDSNLKDKVGINTGNNKGDTIEMKEIKNNIILDIKNTLHDYKLNYNINSNIYNDIDINNILLKDFKYYIDNKEQIIDTHYYTEEKIIKLNKKINPSVNEKKIISILKLIDNYKNIYNGIWEITDKKINSKIHKILIITYGNIFSIGITLDNMGFKINVYRLYIEENNDNIKLFNKENTFELISTSGNNDIKYLKLTADNSYYKKLINIGTDIKTLENYLNNTEDLFKKINYIIDPIKDIKYITQYNLIEDFNNYQKYYKNNDKKCLSTIIIQIIYKKILLIKTITNNNLEQADTIHSSLKILEKKYSDLMTQENNRDDMSIINYKIDNNTKINKLEIHFTNIIGNVLRFKSKIINNSKKHTHKHDISKTHKNEEHNDEDKLIFEEDINIDNNLVLLNSNIHEHEHTHNKDDSYTHKHTDELINVCNSKKIPEYLKNKITYLIENNEYVYYYEKIGKEHCLAFKNDISINIFNDLIILLKEDYKDFNTGYINCKLKDKEYQKYIIGNKAIIELITPLNNNNNLKLENITINKNVFNNIDCTIEFNQTKYDEPKSIFNYDMFNEFCI